MLNWYMLAQDHKRISFQYNGKVIEGMISVYFDGEDDEPEERGVPWFALEGPIGYGIDEVSNVKILD